VLVLLLKIIEIRHRLDFKIKIKVNLKISKNIGIFLKIADVVDDTSENNTDEKIGEKPYLFSIKFKFGSFLVSAV